MGDGEKALSGSNSTPKSAWNSTAQPSPQTLVFLLFESLMMPWALPKSLRTTSRTAALVAISSTTWFLCCASLSSVAWLATTTPTMPTV